MGGDGGWRVVAAGPTTSVRENPYEPGFIRRSGVRVIIGKGGMDAATLEAMRECGAVYVQAVGGAAAMMIRVRYAFTFLCKIGDGGRYNPGAVGKDWKHLKGREVR